LNIYLRKEDLWLSLSQVTHELAEFGSNSIRHMRNLYERKRDHSSTSRERPPRTCSAKASGRIARDRHGEAT